MLGQGAMGGKINPEKGKDDEVYLPFPVDLPSRFGMSNFLAGRVSFPWMFNNTAAGKKANAQNKRSDALLAVSNKPSEINIYQVPTIVVNYQLPRNSSQGGMQVGRLPLNMVNPRLAWRPG